MLEEEHKGQMDVQSKKRIRRWIRTLATIALVIFLLLLAGELVGTFSEAQRPVVELFQWIILGIFMSQLLVEFYFASSKKTFLKDNWFNILALIPVVRVLRAARALRAVKLVRMFRVARVGRAEKTLKASRRTLKYARKSRWWQKVSEAWMGQWPR